MTKQEKEIGLMEDLEAKINMNKKNAEKLIKRIDKELAELKENIYLEYEAVNIAHNATLLADEIRTMFELELLLREIKQVYETDDKEAKQNESEN